MTFLPIVERELRVAARHGFTYWSRPVAAAVALVVFGLVMAMWSMENLAGATGIPIGTIEFGVLEWLVFAIACLAGVFLTSDSLSEEKRSGTLGLLFLTDLRGYDVVFGKLMSHSLRAFYGLLAAFPVLALPLMMGGLSGAEFGRAMLVICNTLFLSLSVGMFVSSISREVIKAMTAALFLNLVLAGGLPWLDYTLAHWDESKFKCICSIASPAYLLAHLKYIHPEDFWTMFGIQHILGWVFLGTACVCVPRAWQEKAATTTGARGRFSQYWRFGAKRGRVALRRKWLARAPVVWLALRDRWLVRLILFAMCAAFAIQSKRMISHPDFMQTEDVSGLFKLALYFWAALQATRLFVDAVQNGAMELMLVTPLTPRQIVQGQWSALKRTFLPPAIFILALNLAAQLVQQYANRHRTGPAGYVVPFNTHILLTAEMFLGPINLLMELSALGWFGMWMGLNSRKTSMAVLKTFCFVLIIPLFVELFLQGFGYAVLWRFRIPTWVVSIGIKLLNIVKDIVFIVWSRRSLYLRLRQTVASAGQRVQRPARPPVPVTAPRTVTT